MSAGNLNTPNGKKNNFTYQFNVLRLLGELNGNSDQVEALLQSIENNTDNVEFLLNGILTSLQQGTEYEAKLVTDTCDSNRVYLEVRVWDTDNSTWGPTTYYDPSSSTPVIPVGLSTPGCLKYTDPSTLLASILTELQLKADLTESQFVNINEVGGASVTLGPKTPGNSFPIVFPTVTTSGNITTQNLVPTGTATANSAVEITLNGYSNLTIQTTGTYTGALTLQGTVNGTTWVTFGGTPLINTNTGGALATITSALQSTFQAEVGGFVRVRITALAAVTGTVTVTLNASQSSTIVDVASIAAGSSVIGSVSQSGTWTVMPGNSVNTTPWLANPLTPTVTTTGDSGAKTSSGNGSGVTNATSKGALITLNITVVSGTTPTCVFKIQGSADGGTTWIDVPGAATASLTTTGVYGIMIYPGITPVAGVATTGTTSQTSSTLPRLYRLAWTIGGTTPSFTIGSANVSYLI